VSCTYFNDDFIGTNRWWLKEVKGATILDNFLLFILKIIYLGLKFLLKIVLGRERANSLCIKQGVFYFNDFLYKSINFLRLDNLVLLKINVPKYDYKIYCPSNKEDFIIVTKHEDEIIERFNPKQGDVVVDVGAHIGRYTIISSKRVGPHGKVIAIEAHPGNFEMLNRNIQLNKLTNAIALKYAIHSKLTNIKLYTYREESSSTGHNSIMFNHLSIKYKEKFVEVNANTLDHVLQLNGIREVNWIKIDVEGAEFELLKGATNILSKSKDISLLIEVHFQEYYKPILEFLNFYNFKIEFDKTYENGEKHIIMRKSSSLTV
jgi:FkbM family methyltransferase